MISVAQGNRLTIQPIACSLTSRIRSDAVLDVVYNNTDTSAIHYDGEWDLQTIHFAPSITLTAPLHRTSAHGASATLDFIGEAVAVYGLRVWGSWLYNVVSFFCASRLLRQLVEFPADTG